MTLYCDIMNAKHIVMATFLWILPIDLCAQASPPINYCAQNYVYEVAGDCIFSGSYWSDDEVRNLLIGEVIEIDSEIQLWQGRFAFLEDCFVKVPDLDVDFDFEKASCRRIPRPYDSFGNFMNAMTWTIEDGLLKMRDHYEQDSFTDFRIDLSCRRGTAITILGNRLVNAGDVELKTGTLPLFPPISDCFDIEVRERLAQWKERGEFELLENYLKRVNVEALYEKVEELEIQIFSEYEELTERFFNLQKKEDREFAVLHAYDPDKQMFVVDVKYFGSFLFKVPIAEAPQFKSKFESNTLNIEGLDYTTGKFEISQLRCNNFLGVPNSAIHLKSTSNKLAARTDVLEDFQVQFTDGLIDKYSANQSEVVNFNRASNYFDVTSVAVIPKPSIDCFGDAYSLASLASLAENYILAHYTVVDRRNLDSVLEELRLQMSGLTFEQDVISSGCIENAQAYLFVQQNCMSGIEMIEVRLVHCETSNVIWSCSGLNSSLQSVLERVDDELRKSR